MLLPQWSTRPCPIIGMLHVPPLPGSPGYQGDFSSVRHSVLRDAERLVEGGIDGLMLENYGDTPFYPGRVPAATVAAMTSLGTDLQWRFQVPLGINVLRNDGQSALAVAVACGASFIRVNVLCGARVADQGLIQAIAHDLLRDRANLKATSIQIWADVDVKHSVALAPRSIELEVHDLIDRGHCDAVIVSGDSTGQPVDLEFLRKVRAVSQSTPLLIGSGVTVDTAPELATIADGLIVGTSIKQDGAVHNPVDLCRAKRVVQAVNAAVSRPSSDRS